MKIFKSGRIIGYMTKFMYLTERRAEHFFRRWQAFGLSKKLVYQLRDDGVKTIYFFYEGAEYHIYRVTLQDVIDKHIPYKHKNYDSQMLITLKNLQEITDKADFNRLRSLLIREKVK